MLLRIYQSFHFNVKRVCTRESPLATFVIPRPEIIESGFVVAFFLGELLLIFDRVLTLASKVEFELSSARNILTLSGRAPKLPLFCSILRCTAQERMTVQCLSTSDVSISINYQVHEYRGIGARVQRRSRKDSLGCSSRQSR